MPSGPAPAISQARAFALMKLPAPKSGVLGFLLTIFAALAVAGCSVTIGPQPTPGTPQPGQPTNTPIEQIQVDITRVPTPTLGPPTATRGPVGEPVEYTIKSGDTLSGIADMFGITVEDIVRFNNITDPNSIYEGQVLLIPPAGGTGGSSPSGASATPQAAETGTAVP